MTTAPKPNLRERTRGRWLGILTALGVHPRYLVDKHGPCPICNAGKDRFRFDNKNGDGTYFCSQCGAGSGTDLVMKMLGLPFKEAASRIEQVIGDSSLEPAPRPRRSDAQNRAALNALWMEGRPVRRDDPVDRWLRSRSIAVELYPAILRTADRVFYPGGGRHPAMLAMVSNPGGKTVMIHKTYITQDGQKAPVDEPRRFACGTIPDGAAVRLAAHTGVLGIAEGIETAFAVMRLFSIPCWAALNAGMLDKFQPPAAVNHLLIYGDNDAHLRGQRAAWSLAGRLKIKVDVQIPDAIDTDWNDVLMAVGGR